MSRVGLAGYQVSDQAEGTIVRIHPVTAVLDQTASFADLGSECKCPVRDP